MYCRNCGQELRENERYCPNCGAPVGAQKAADLSAALRGVQELSGGEAAYAQRGALSETPSLTQDFAVTRERFNLILGGTLLWGFVMNVLFCLFFTEAVARMSYTLIMLLYMALAFAGILINKYSNKPIWSFVGYNLVVLPLGLVLSALLADADPDAVRETFQITAGVTAGLLLLSNWKPDFFSKIAPCLFGTLLLALIGEVVLFLFNRSFEWVNVLVALIFCGYIGVDWARAQQRPATADNAIDSACALYLDIINLLLRVLASRSRTNRRK